MFLQWMNKWNKPWVAHRDWWELSHASYAWWFRIRFQKFKLKNGEHAILVKTCKLLCLNCDSACVCMCVSIRERKEWSLVWSYWVSVGTNIWVYKECNPDQSEKQKRITPWKTNISYFTSSYPTFIGSFLFF